MPTHLGRTARPYRVMIVRSCNDLAPAQGAGTRFGLVLDRDGVINVDRGFVASTEEFEFVLGAVDAVRRAKELGMAVAIVTNQSGIGRGLYTLGQFMSLTEWLGGQIEVDAVYYCPHAPEENCPGRKPSPTLVTAAVQELGIDPQKCWMVGDKETDMAAAAAAGIQGLRFSSGGNLLEFLEPVFGAVTRSENA